MDGLRYLHLFIQLEMYLLFLIGNIFMLLYFCIIVRRKSIGQMLLGSWASFFFVPIHKRGYFVAIQIEVKDEQASQKEDKYKNKRRQAPYSNHFSLIIAKIILSPQLNYTNQKRNKICIDRKHHEDKKFIIFLPYAMIDPYAVMIESLNTSKSLNCYIRHLRQWMLLPLTRLVHISQQSSEPQAGLRSKALLDALTRLSNTFALEVRNQKRIVREKVRQKVIPKPFRVGIWVKLESMQIVKTRNQAITARYAMICVNTGGLLKAFAYQLPYFIILSILRKITMYLDVAVHILLPLVLFSSYEQILAVQLAETCYQLVLNEKQYVNYLIQAMLSNKISLINHLKSTKAQQQIFFDQVLVIIHENSITLHEARRFLLQKNIERYIDWRIMAFEEILGVSEDSYRHTINNRPYWLQQRKLYQTSLLKFHQLQSKITQQDQEFKRKSKLEILQQLKDQNGRPYEVYRRSLDEQDFSQLILQLQGIVEFQQEANSYIFANDYESNQVINKCLEQLNEKKLNESMIKSHLRKQTLDSPITKIKTNPGSMIKSKSIGQLKGKYRLKQSISRNNSEKTPIFQKDRKNFIHQIREEIRRQQRKSSLARSISENQSTGNNRLVSVHLPKILKLSDEAISTQGIYKSLKKFTDFDFVAQQKKIRDIIGISLGQEEQFMSAYFSRQRSVKQQKQFQQHINRQQRRIKILEGLAKKQHHHCKRYIPEEVQPYMRF